MKPARMMQVVQMYLHPSGKRRADYLRKKHVFHHVGKNVTWQSRKIPLYAELISLHDNVFIASNVSFVTHDIAHLMLNKMPDVQHKFRERIGCIEIMDNVFVGAGTKIMYNVRIGSNVIVAAGSIVTHDLEPDGVYAGVPARRIKSIEEYVAKLESTPTYPPELSPKKQEISPALRDWMWERFATERDGQKDGNEAR